MLISVLLLGFVIGMQHAFEADHLAAVSTLVSRQRDRTQMVRHGALWGAGHTLALLVLSAVVLVGGWALPAGFGAALESIVGVMLVFLGGQLLYRLWRDRVHIHVHEHPSDGAVHVHAHSHRGEHGPHAKSDHDHRHPKHGWRTLLVGLTHGVAGSAALTVYLAASLESPGAGLIYVLLFGAGSIVGMAVLSAAIAVPLTATADRLTWLNRGLQAAMGLISVFIGLRLVMAQSAHWIA